MTENARRQRLLAALAAKTKLCETRLAGILRSRTAFSEELAAASAAADGPHAVLLLQLTGLQNRIIRLESEMAQSDQAAAELRRELARLKAASASIGRRHLAERARQARQQEEISIIEHAARTRNSLRQDE